MHLIKVIYVVLHTLFFQPKIPLHNFRGVMTMLECQNYVMWEPLKERASMYADGGH